MDAHYRSDFVRRILPKGMSSNLDKLRERIEPVGILGVVIQGNMLLKMIFYEPLITVSRQSSPLGKEETPKEHATELLRVNITALQELRWKNKDLVGD